MLAAAKRKRPPMASAAARAVVCGAATHSCSTALSGPVQFGQVVIDGYHTGPAGPSLEVTDGAPCDMLWDTNCTVSESLLGTTTGAITLRLLTLACAPFW